MTRYSATELRHLDALGEFQSTRQDALTVECPRCEAPVDQLCVNTITGELLRAPAHPERIARFERKDVQA
ncbi:zinc finger domain-containing protein [Amycolatopsis tolypomycina]|uniref:zinc finger domain-containing protein n=1 Tax=Amycolatopsis tolypomycina TaxID=208445 RepID=UPI0033B60D4D